MKCGLLYGPDIHHLDHLAPLCHILDIPLCVTEEAIAKRANECYPHLEIILCDHVQLPIFILERFELVLTSLPKPLFREIFFFAEQILKKKAHTLWCPHGNSDKGHSHSFWEALREEEMILLYGKQMFDAMQAEGILDKVPGHVITGNYRWEFYRSYLSFYHLLVEREIRSRLPPAKRTILYAPTWLDASQSSSFFDALPILVDLLPADQNLIVKPHPNLMLAHPTRTSLLIEQFSSHPRLLFLEEFPPIYPLLDIADVYIGDMSSVGYDFLTFDRPLFFLNQHEKKNAYLFRTGIEISKANYEHLYNVIDEFFAFELRDFSALRKEVYTYAFGHPKSLDMLRKEIEAMISTAIKLL